MFLDHYFLNSLVNIFAEDRYTDFFYLSLVFLLFIYLLRYKFLSINLISKKKFIQTIHEGQVPRLGGAIIFFYIFINKFLNEDSNYLLPLLTLTPIVFISILEDIFHIISPKIRLIFMFLSAFLLLFYCINQFPVIDSFSTLNYFLSYDFFRYIFFTMCLVGLMNGLNLIDGTNGTFILTILSSVLSLAFLSFTYQHNDIFNNLVFIIPLCLSFLLFNFPLGKFFMGDTGPYFLGGLVGYFAIDLFGRTAEINSWNLLLIFFYPITELFYSFFRKIFTKKSPFSADDKHLHLKLYNIFNMGLKNRSLVANNMVVIFLLGFIFFPLLIIPIVYKSTLLIFIAYSIILIGYIFLNLCVNQLRNKNEEN